jgi:hypothetical protein
MGRYPVVHRQTRPKELFPQPRDGPERPAEPSWPAFPIDATLLRQVQNPWSDEMLNWTEPEVGLAIRARLRGALETRPELFRDWKGMLEDTADTLDIADEVFRRAADAFGLETMQAADRSEKVLTRKPPLPMCQRAPSRLGWSGPCPVFE